MSAGIRSVTGRAYHFEFPVSLPPDPAGRDGQGRQFHALKAFGAMHSFGMGISPVQFRVRVPVSARVAQLAEARR